MDAIGCRHCEDAEAFEFDFTFAFQPIIEWSSRRMFAYEALVRGTEGGGAGVVLSKVTNENRYAFDQRARVRAIALATELFPDDGSLLSINVMPNAIYEPRRCLRTTLNAAETHGFPIDRIMFEMTEHERILDLAHVKRIVEHYSASGFTTAIDDFGKSFANLDFLTAFQPHVLKVDRSLLRGLDQDPVRRALLRGLKNITAELDIRLVAEGVETVGEFACLLDLGYDTFQGFLFARPGFRTLPRVDFAGLADALGRPPEMAAAVLRERHEAVL